MSTTPLPEDSATELDQISTVTTSVGQDQDDTRQWFFVFHKCNKLAGTLIDPKLYASDTLGGMMEKVGILYQEFLPKSSLRRLFGFFTKIIVEIAIVYFDLSLGRDIKVQNTLVQVQAGTNIKHDRYTDAFYAPENYHEVAIQDEKPPIVHPITPPSRTVLSVRTVLNKSRIIWAIFISTTISLVLGVIAGVTSGDLMTAIGVSGALLTLLGVFLVLAAWLLKL